MHKLFRSRWPQVTGLAALGVLVLLPLASLVFAFASDLVGGATGAPRPVLAVRPLLLLWRSLVLAVCSAALATVLGLVAGYALAGLKPRWQRLGVLVVLIPLLIPPFLHAVAWILIGAALHQSWHGFLIAVMVLGLAFWPLGALLIWVGLRASQGQLREAALLGPSRVCAFWKIELGLIRPHLVTTFLFVALFSFSDYGVPSLFRLTTYPVFVFSQFAGFYDFSSGIRAAWPYVLLPLAAIWLWRRTTLGRLHETLRQQNLLSPLRTSRLAQNAVRTVFALLVLLSVALPIIVLVHTAGAGYNYFNAWETARRQIVSSFWLAALSATGAALVGLLLGLGTRSGQGIGSAARDYLNFLPVALPGTIFGLGIITLWNRPATQFVYGTVAAIVLLYLARVLPFAACIQAVGLGQVSSSLWEATEFADAPPRRRIWRILLPLAAPSLLASWAVSFVLSVQELTGTLLVTPPGVETLSLRIYSLYHYGATALVAALALFLVGLSLGVFALVLLAGRRLKSW